MTRTPVVRHRSLLVGSSPDRHRAQLDCGPGSELPTSLPPELKCMRAIFMLPYIGSCLQPVLSSTTIIIRIGASHRHLSSHIFSPRIQGPAPKHQRPQHHRHGRQQGPVAMFCIAKGEPIKQPAEYSGEPVKMKYKLAHWPDASTDERRALAGGPPWQSTSRGAPGSSVRSGGGTA